jgi:VWFA-related protein
MHANYVRLVFMVVGVLLTAASLTADWPRLPAAPLNRTVLVTVTDRGGAPVTDLTPADFVVKEGGKEREIVKAERAKARLRLALGIEERLAPDTAVRLGVFEFVKRIASAAEISVITIGLANRTVVDFTSDPAALVGGINTLTLNAVRESNLAEGILEIVEGFIAKKPERPAIVVVAIAGGPTSTDPRNVLAKLGDSGATLHTVALGGAGMSSAPVGGLSDEGGRDQVLGDGPKQSGGRHLTANATAGVPKALQQIADDLLSQYAITYVLPDGVKPTKRISITTKRRGVTLRAPSTIPD